MKRKTLSALLCSGICLSLIPAPVFADEQPQAVSPEAQRADDFINRHQSAVNTGDYNAVFSAFAEYQGTDDITKNLINEKYRSWVGMSMDDLLSAAINTINSYAANDYNTAVAIQGVIAGYQASGIQIPSITIPEKPVETPAEPVEPSKPAENPEEDKKPEDDENSNPDKEDENKPEDSEDKKDDEIKEPVEDEEKPAGSEEEKTPSLETEGKEETEENKQPVKDPVKSPVQSLPGASEEEEKKTQIVQNALANAAAPTENSVDNGGAIQGAALLGPAFYTTLNHGTNRLIKVSDFGNYNLLPDFNNQAAWKNAATSYNIPGLWGQCTWFAWGRFYEIYGFDPGFRGDGYMCASQLVNVHSDKFELSKTPKSGAIFSGDSAHNHVGVVLEYNEKTNKMIVQEGNMDGVSNPIWSIAIQDYRTIEVSPDQLRNMYGNVTYAVPKDGKVHAVDYKESKPKVYKAKKKKIQVEENPFKHLKFHKM